MVAKAISLLTCLSWVRGPQKTNECRVSVLIAALLMSLPALAGPIAISEVSGYLHYDGALQTVLSTGSVGYSSTLDANNLGEFGWAVTNSTAATLSNVTFLLFLDADIDRDTNSFFNEYGEFVSLALPVFAPVGAFSAGSWEIDEPGLVFGDILINLAAGALDDLNGVPSSAPDDVSLALGFSVGSLGPGQSLITRFAISESDIGWSGP